MTPYCAEKNTWHAAFAISPPEFIITRSCLECPIRPSLRSGSTVGLNRLLTLLDILDDYATFSRLSRYLHGYFVASLEACLYLSPKPVINHLSDGEM